MQVIINGTDFWDNFEPMKYWSHPKSYDAERKRREAREMMLSGSYIGARKMDGIWSMIIKDENGIFHLRSRTKNVQGTYADKAEWIPSILNELNNLPNGTVLLGEIYKYGDEGSRKATSILNCLKDKSLERQKKTPLHFYVFDCLAWGGDILIDMPIIKRIAYIAKAQELNSNGNFIEYAIYYEGVNLLQTYVDILTAGGEGIVIQKKEASYTCGKRTARLSLKCKQELQETIDAFIDGSFKPATQDYTGKNVETWQFWRNAKTGENLPLGNHYAEYVSGMTVEPITKYAYYGWAGAISFSVMRDGKPFHIAWISGITDEMRKGIVENPEEWKYRVYELTAMQVEFIDNQYSLRHGKIVGERTDKDMNECDYSQLATS